MWGEVGVAAGDAGGGIAIGVDLGEAEFHIDVGREGLEDGIGIHRVGILAPEVFVDHAQAVFYLLIGDVAKALPVNDVHHHRDGDEGVFIAVGALAVNAFANAGEQGVFFGSNVR